MNFRVIPPREPIRVFRGTTLDNGGTFGVQWEGKSFTVAVVLIDDNSPTPDNEDLTDVFLVETTSQQLDRQGVLEIVDAQNALVEFPGEMEKAIFMRERSQLSFRLKIRGDHPYFRSDRFRKEGDTPFLSFKTYVLEDGSSQWTQSNNVQFRMQIREIEEFPNAFAIDVGTTNSCAAYMDGNPPTPRLFQHSQNRGSSIASIVKYSEPGSDRQQVKVGEAALRDEDELNEPIRSFKRYMGIKNHRFRPSLNFNTFEISPPEVYRDFVQEYLSEFQNKGPRLLKQASATFPPNYSSQAKGAIGSVYSSLGFRTDRLLKYDEASSAAVYYVYRALRDFEFDLKRFMAKFGNCHNLLVFDLGGGTTDVSLVEVLVQPDSVDLKVLSNASLLHVGGDNFTLAMLKAIRARIAMRTARLFQESPERFNQIPISVRSAFEALGDRYQEFESALESPSTTEVDMYRLQELDELACAAIQTNWKAIEDPFQSLAAKCAFDVLWSLAEKAKIGVVNHGSYKFAELNEVTTNYFKSTLKIVPLELFTGLQVDLQVDLNRRIAGMIRKAVRASRRMTTLDAGHQIPIHSIQLAGNSCRISLVKEIMIQEFADTFPTIERMIEFDPETAKSSVALGACVAAHINDYGRNFPIKINFNPVPEKLGWDIGTYEDGFPFQTFFHADCRPSDRPAYFLEDREQTKIEIYRRLPGSDLKPEFMGAFTLLDEPKVYPNLGPTPPNKLALILQGSDKMALRRNEKAWFLRAPENNIDSKDDPFSGTH